MIRHVGIDFDNTIVIYDDVFHRHAVADFGMPRAVPADKPAIRNYFFGYKGQGGYEHWVELQGIVYGTRMEEARMAEGLDRVLRECAAAGIRISIISHKTEYAAMGPRVHLHEAAWRWLDARGLLADGAFGIGRDDVFFETERSRKLERIAQRGCDVFVDDLPEVFAEPSFPAGARKILYDPADSHQAGPGITKARSWETIGGLILGFSAGR